MTRVNPFTRPAQGEADPSPSPCDPVPEDLADRIIEAIRAETDAS